MDGATPALSAKLQDALDRAGLRMDAGAVTPSK
jgi:hypothetical protein